MEDQEPFSPEDTKKNPVAELVETVTKSVVGNHELSKALDDEMERPPDDRSPLT